MHLTCTVVNDNVFVTIAKSLRIANDRNLLSEYGGSTKLDWKWCMSVFKQMKWVNRKCTTNKPPIATGLIKEVHLL